MQQGKRDDPTVPTARPTERNSSPNKQGERDAPFVSGCYEPTATRWWMPAICRRSWRFRPRQVRGAAMTPTAPAAPATIRRYGRSGTGWLGSCTAAWPVGSPTRSSLPGRLARRRRDYGSRGAGGCNPPAILATGLPGGPWCRWGRVAARSSAMGRPGSLAAWDQAPPKAAPLSQRVRPHALIALDCGDNWTPAAGVLAVPLAPAQRPGCCGSG
jgi:hypothetical protein